METLTNEENDLNEASEPDPNDQLLETLMLGLRLQQGVNLDAIAQQFGSEKARTIIEVLTPYRQQNWVNLAKQDGQHWGQLRLSDPEGLLFSNTILAQLFHAFTEEMT